MTPQEGHCPSVPEYRAAIVKAWFDGALPYGAITSVCPECDEIVYADEPGDHVLLGDWEIDEAHRGIGNVVIVGCEGYLIVDPNLLGWQHPGWQDWRDYQR